MTRTTARKAGLAAFALLSVGTMGAAGQESWRVLRPGLVVEAEGELKNERFVVKEIDVRTKEASDKFELIAPIDVVTAESRSIVALDLAVAVPDDCKIRDEVDTPLALTDLRAGDWLEIDGTSASGTLSARRIRVLSEVPAKRQFEGTITKTALEKRRIEVAGVSLRLSRSATVRGGEALPPARVIVDVPRFVDEDDGRPAIWSALDGRIRGGGGLEAEVSPERNFNLNPTRPGDLTVSTWTADAQFDARFTEFEAFFKAGFRNRRIHLDEEGDEVNDSQLRVQQLFGLWRPVSQPSLALQVGRQDFDEKREWLYDENLDGVRLHAQLGRFRTEASVSTRYNVRSNRLVNWTNWIGLTRTEVKSRWFASAYAIHRRLDGDPGNRPLWLGLRSRGRIKSGIKHWAELSMLRGRSNDLDLSAWAFDVGMRLRLRRQGHVNLTFGYALGSGGADDAQRFRQTGLHDNNGKFGGVSSFKYYGELLEPDLSNLAITTAAFGFRPSKASSVDLVYHGYRQPHAAPKLYGTNLESRPRGENPNVGTEWDLIFAFEEFRGVEIEYVFAQFNPGDAFDPIATSARFHQLSVELNF